MNLKGNGVNTVMTEEIKNLNFTDALKALDNVSKDCFTTDAWIPSMGKNIKIKELTAKQQKNLLESAIDSTVSKFTFGKVFFEIMSNNCLEEKSIVENLTIADKVSIAFNLRSQISENIKVIFSDDPKVESNISLSTILDNIKNYIHPQPEDLEATKNGTTIKINISLPNILKESKFDAFLYEKGIREDKIEEVKTIITSAFLGEAAKYINEIYIDETQLNYSSLTVPQKLQFVEKLPAILIQKILEKVVIWKEDLEKMHTVYQDNNKKVVEINNILFLSN